MDEILSGFFGLLFSIFTFFLWGVGLFFVALVLKYALEKVLFRQKVQRAIDKNDNAYLLIKISPNNENKEASMEAFFHNLHRVLPNNTPISLELVSSDQFLRFYIVVPKTLKGVLESQMYAQYPEAEVEETADYMPDFATVPAAFAEIKFKKTSTMPFNTYQNLEESLLKNISAFFAKTEKGEGVILQLTVKRTGSKFWERGMTGARHKFFGKKYVAEDQTHPAQQKLSQDLYRGKLRIAYIAANKPSASVKLSTLLGLLKGLKGPYNELKKKKYYLVKPVFPGLFKTRLFENGDFWTVSELATIYHFPYKGSIVSNVVNTSSKRAPAPDLLPREGIVTPSEMTLIGETNYRNDHMRFGLKRFDRRRHVYVVGKTGSGKSKLLELLVMADIQQGQGCCLLDPHGDLAEEVLKFVPRERIKDVVYVNPTDSDFPIGFNPLEPVTDYQMRQHLSTFFISIFKKLFAANWNARMEHLMRYITLALLETPDSSVLGIQRILSDTNFRQRVIKQIQDPVVKGYWLNDFSASDQNFTNEAVIPILNKIGQFTSNPVVRNMIGQKKNMLDFEKFMNNGNIVIINVSKGKLGDENAALLGAMFITKIQQAALNRAKIPEEERKDFYFYVDEFQNFATDAFSSILSEARKYRLDLTIAHQYIAQLPEDVKATAFGNVGTIISFGIGADDAAYLAKEFSPTFSPDDMINLNTREMYIKMSVDGRVTTPFSARTVDVPKPPFNFLRDIVDYSRMTYAKNRVAVENEIAQWTQGGSVLVEEGEESFPEPII